MNAKDKYNTLIRRIEERAFSTDHVRASNILEEICKLAGIGIREINAVFAYLTGMPLLEYIKERKLMASYSFLINEEEFDVNTPLEIAGYDNQSSYGKRFKEKFDMTPREAFAQKTASAFTKPLTWENISADDEEIETMFDQVQSVQDTLFGVDAEKLEQIKQADDLRIIFGLNNVQSNVAYQLSLTENVAMLKAFEFVDDFSQMFCLNSDQQFSMTQKQFQKAIEEKLDLFHLCIITDFPVKRAASMMDTMRDYGYKPEDIPLDILKCFHWGDISFTEFIELYKAYVYYGGTTPFAEYMALVLEDGWDEEFAATEGLFEECCDEVMGSEEHWRDFNSCDFQRKAMERDMERYMEFEQWAERETDYDNSDYHEYEYDDEGGFFY